MLDPDNHSLTHGSLAFVIRSDMAKYEIITGVYGIYCIPTNKWYIGASYNVKKRLKQHRSEMRNCPHWFCNRGMYQDVNKYGLEKFKFYILKHCSPGELKEVEQEWIDRVDSIATGYNSQRPGWNRYWRLNGEG